MGCRLDLSNRLHQGVPDDDADVCSRVAVRLLAQSDKVGLRETVGGGAQMELEHEGASVLLGQWDVDPLLKSVTVSQVDSEHRRETAARSLTTCQQEIVITVS